MDSEGRARILESLPHSGRAEVGPLFRDRGRTVGVGGGGGGPLGAVEVVPAAEAAARWCFL